MPTSEASLVARVLVWWFRAVTGDVAFDTAIVTLLLFKVVTSVLVPVMEVVLISGSISIIMSFITSAAHETPTIVIVIRIEATHVTTATTITIAIASSSATPVIVVLMMLLTGHALIHATTIVSFIMIFSLASMIGVVLTLLWIG